MVFACLETVGCMRISLCAYLCICWLDNKKTASMCHQAKGVNWWITAHNVNNCLLYLRPNISSGTNIYEVNLRVIPLPQSTSCPRGGVLEDNTFCQWNRICESAIWTGALSLRSVWSSETDSQPLRDQDLGSDWPEEGEEGGGQSRAGQGPLNRYTLDQKSQLISCFFPQDTPKLKLLIVLKFHFSHTRVVKQTWSFWLD